MGLCTTRFKSSRADNLPRPLLLGLRLHELQAWHPNWTITKIVQFQKNVSMNYRAAKTIIALPADQGVVLYDYTSKTAARCSTDALHWMHYFSAWHEIAEAISAHPQWSEKHVRETIEALVELGFIYSESDQRATFQKDFEENWNWGHAAAMFHFSVLNNPFHSAEESRQMQLEKSERAPSPILFWRNPEEALQLDQPNKSEVGDLLTLMAKRRTNRTCLQQNITTQQIADCLRAGLGITGFVETETGLLPLAMTPSGGARNPYEAYVMVRNVDGLAPGFYHYSAIDHSLESISRNLPNRPSSLLAGQEWVDEMPAVVFLVAAMERTMWKYPDANAYRVILIEAGHIGQNIMLAATAHGLSACPTAALSHEDISRHLELEKITHVPIYALSIGVPGEYDAKVITPRQYQDLTAAH
jgi:SagB-type dehydrogenase family enzyme